MKQQILDQLEIFTSKIANKALQNENDELSILVIWDIYYWPFRSIITSKIGQWKCVDYENRITHKNVTIYLNRGRFYKTSTKLDYVFVFDKHLDDELCDFLNSENVECFDFVTVERKLNSEKEYSE